MQDLLETGDRSSSMHELIQTADCMSNVVEGITTVDLIRMFYGSSIRIEACTKSIAEELKKRMKDLDVDKLEENKQILFEIYNQCMSGKQVLQSAKERVSEIVRVRLQQIINQTCHGTINCNLSSETGILSNELLKALDYFGKYMVVPSHVGVARLNGLELTSLWLKFGRNSQIHFLAMRDNNFEELNNETFGRFIHETAGQRIRIMVIDKNKHLIGVDFDELMLITKH